MGQALGGAGERIGGAGCFWSGTEEELGGGEGQEGEDLAVVVHARSYLLYENLLAPFPSSIMCYQTRYGTFFFFYFISDRPTGLSCIQCRIGGSCTGHSWSLLWDKGTFVPVPQGKPQAWVCLTSVDLGHVAQG